MDYVTAWLAEWLAVQFANLVIPSSSSSSGNYFLLCTKKAPGSICPLKMDIREVWEGKCGQLWYWLHHTFVCRRSWKHRLNIVFPNMPLMTWKRESLSFFFFLTSLMWFMLIKNVHFFFQALYGLCFALVFLVVCCLVNAPQYARLPDGYLEDISDAWLQFRNSWRIILAVIGKWT